MAAQQLSTNPLHLGLGATSVVQPEFTGEMSWYGEYSARHGDDGAEGRLVTMHSFTSSWDVWEVHPVGSEVVLCTAGRITLLQEIDGEHVRTTLGPGEYAVNEPGTWHTAEIADGDEATCLFITAGEGTDGRSIADFPVKPSR